MPFYNVPDNIITKTKVDLEWGSNFGKREVDVSLDNTLGIIQNMMFKVNMNSIKNIMRYLKRAKGDLEKTQGDLLKAIKKSRPKIGTTPIKAPPYALYNKLAEDTNFYLTEIHRYFSQMIDSIDHFRKDSRRAEGHKVTQYGTNDPMKIVEKIPKYDELIVKSRLMAKVPLVKEDTTIEEFYSTIGKTINDIMEMIKNIDIATVMFSEFEYVKTILNKNSRSFEYDLRNDNVRDYEFSGLNELFYLELELKFCKDVDKAMRLINMELKKKMDTYLFAVKDIPKTLSIISKGV